MTGAVAIFGFTVFLVLCVVGVLATIGMVKLARRAFAPHPVAELPVATLQFSPPSAVESAKAVQSHINNLGLEHFLANAGKAEAAKIGQQFAGYAANGSGEAPKS